MPVEILPIIGGAVFTHMIIPSFIFSTAFFLLTLSILMEFLGI